MTSIFEPYLALAERADPTAADRSMEERAAILEDRVAAHMGVFDAMQRRIGDQYLTQLHRPLIPLYQRWMNAAREMVARAREFRAEGRVIAGIDELVCDINLSKLVAESFHRTVEFNDRVKRGEKFGPYRPADEVFDELRSQPRATS
jgi:hypothetical protein